MKSEVEVDALSCVNLQVEDGGRVEVDEDAVGLLGCRRQRVP